MKFRTAAVAVSADSSQALVTRLRSRMDRGEVYRVGLDKKLALYQTVALRVHTTTIDAEIRTRGVPHYLHQVGHFAGRPACRAAVLSATVGRWSTTRRCAPVYAHGPLVRRAPITLAGH